MEIYEKKLFGYNYLHINAHSKFRNLSALMNDNKFTY